jgi:RHS repeat-associated protein
MAIFALPIDSSIPSGITLYIPFENRKRDGSIYNEKNDSTEENNTGSVPIFSIFLYFLSTEENNTGSVPIFSFYDGAKRLVKTTDASGGITSFSYQSGCSSCGGGGDLTSLTDPKNQATTFTYDKGLMIKETNPLGKSRTYIYNHNKQITGIVDYKGQMTTFAYDAIGRLKGKTTVDDTFTYTYDAAGRMTSAKNATSDFAFTFDVKGNLISEKDNAKNTQITYTYDNYGNRITMTGPMGTTTYAYDNYNRLTSIADPNGKITKYTNDQLGRRTKEELPNSITTTYAYDDINRLNNLLTQNSQTQTINSFAFAYDKVGNKTSMTTLSGTHAYGYDQTYQLTSATHPDQLAENYSYDKIGNRNPLTYKHSAWNQILEDDKFTFTYDDNGNRKEKTAKDGTLRDVYTWNAENRLIKFERYDNINSTTPITTASYKYDALGRRIEKNVNNAVTGYIYDGLSIIAETDNNNNIVTTYTHGEGIDEPISMTRNNKTYFYHRDSLGSITSLTDETGNIVQEYRYDSFGNITYIKDPNFIQPFTFTGREFDPESGLYYYRERTYDSYTGTFPSVDPIEFGAGDVNLFRYVGNNPVNFVDPLGLEMLLLGRQPFIFRYPGVNRLAPKQRFTPRNFPKETPVRECKPVQQPTPSPVPEPSWWGRFLKDLADWLDELGGGAGPTLPYDPNSDLVT